jgi:immunity protein 8 of polymorphic toxin system
MVRNPARVGAVGDRGSMCSMSVQPEIKRLHSPDVFDLTAWSPPRGEDFAVLLQVLVGPVGAEGEESFDVVVCTAGWLGGNLGLDGMLSGRHHLLMDEWNYDRLEAFLRRYVAGCSAPTWQGVAEKIGRLGKWEFEDYRPFPSV